MCNIPANLKHWQVFFFGYINMIKFCGYCEDPVERDEMILNDKLDVLVCPSCDDEINSQDISKNV